VEDFEDEGESCLGEGELGCLYESGVSKGTKFGKKGQ
jgi:hypothetical protein